MLGLAVGALYRLVYCFTHLGGGDTKHAISFSPRESLASVGAFAAEKWVH